MIFKRVVSFLCQLSPILICLSFSATIIDLLSSRYLSGFLLENFWTNKSYCYIFMITLYFFSFQFVLIFVLWNCDWSMWLDGREWLNKRSCRHGHNNQYLSMWVSICQTLIWSLSFEIVIEAWVKRWEGINKRSHMVHEISCSLFVLCCSSNYCIDSF